MTRAALQFISSGGFYGAERVLLELACYIQAHGWDSYVLVLESPGAEELLRRAHECGVTAHLLSGQKLNGLATLRQIRDFVVEHRIGLIHSHGYKTNVYSALTRLPRNVRRVGTCHNWISNSFKLKCYEWADKQALRRRFDFVTVVSPPLLEEIQRMGLPSQRSMMIDNGIELEPAAEPETLARLRVELGIKPDESMILRVGRLDAVKGNDVLLKAMAEVVPQARAKLVFLGEGEQLEELTSLAARLNLGDRVVFAGYRRDVTNLLHAADLFCISSYDEGLPIVLLEAMAARVPVVTTAVGAIPGVIRSGESGWLVPPGEVRPLAQAILTALEDHEQARSRAARAYLDYEAGYSREAMGHKYLQIYERLVGSPGIAFPSDY